MYSFISVDSPFKEGKFQGPGTISLGEKAHTLYLNGGTHTVRRDMWEEAYRTGSRIRIGGERCRLEVNSKTTPIVNMFDPNSVQTTLLSSVKVAPGLYIPIKTGTAIDQFWSNKGGIMPGTNTMVTGDPGIGKSSVMMDVLQGIKVTNPESKVLYVSAEMTRIDMMDPDEFMKYYPNLFDKVEFVFAGDYIEVEDGPLFSQALEIILQRGYDVVVYDSMVEIQSIFQAELDLGTTKSAEKFMLNLMQKHNQAKNDREVYTAFLLIQQVKKDGEFVGSKRLEHMITAFMQCRWDVEQRGKKYLEFRKNRRGQVKRRLYFKLGKGVEYDIERYNQESEIAEIMAKNDDVAREMTELELVQLLTGGNVPVEE